MNENKLYKAKLEELMGISSEMHNENMEHVALFWIEMNKVQSWKYSKIFWNWWIAQWECNCKETVLKAGYSLDTPGPLPNMAVNEQGNLILPMQNFVELAKNISGTNMAKAYPAKPIIQKMVTV